MYLINFCQIIFIQTSLSMNTAVSILWTVLRKFTFDNLLCKCAAVKNVLWFFDPVLYKKWLIYLLKSY